MTIHPELPPVTVLMSCYNGEKWLSESIESILNQTFKHFEFLIIDDGSLDSSLSIMKDYAKKDFRIHIESKINSGLPDSLNVGLRKAKGTWIARLDADDIAEPERLQKQYDLVTSDPELIVIGSAFRETDEHGNSGSIQYYPTTHRKLKKNLLTKRRFFAHSSAFYHKEKALKAGGYRPRIKKSEDYDLWLRLSELGKMASIQEPLIRFRTHPDQISHEDSGRRQITDGRVALVSYWIRKIGMPDPVEADDESFCRFRLWVQKKIEELEVYDTRQTMMDIKILINKRSKTLYLSEGSFKKKIILISKGLIRFCFGETFWERIAKEWILLERDK